MSNDMAENSISTLVAALEKEKNELISQTEKGELLFSKLVDAYKKAKFQVDQIKSGLAPPSFKLDDDEDLKAEIISIRDDQLALIKGNKATTSLSSWEWFGSKSDGAKLLKIYNKLMISAFNDEFDMAKSKMRHSSYDTAINKLHSSVKALEKLAETVNVQISPAYLSCKEDELDLWHADLVKKNNEKEERKRQKAILREQNKALGRSSDDDDDDESEIEYQLETYAKELAKARELAMNIAGDSLAKLEIRINKIEGEKAELEAKFARATSQAQITRAGFIYVISNIGSFGEGVCKIGMTRRLEPMDRVVELGDASVPFRFDVHTLAFVDDAPKLEKALHKEFDQKRVNKENHRKEFFRVSPEEVREVMDKKGIESSWYYQCDAKEYRQSIIMRQAMNKERSNKTASQELPETI